MSPTNPIPWHLRPVSVLAFLWALALTGDFLNRQYGIMTYPEGSVHDWGALIDALPVLPDLLWTLGAWAALAGALMLLLLERYAPVVLGLAALALAASTILTLAGGEVPVAEPAALVMIVATLLGIVIWLYSRAQRMHGFLG